MKALTDQSDIEKVLTDWTLRGRGSLCKFNFFFSISYRSIWSTGNWHYGSARLSLTNLRILRRSFCFPLFCIFSRRRYCLMLDDSLLSSLISIFFFLTSPTFSLNLLLLPFCHIHPLHRCINSTTARLFVTFSSYFLCKMRLYLGLEYFSNFESSGPKEYE